MPWYFVVAIVVVAIAALYLFLIFPAARRHPDRWRMCGQYIAHRGLHSLTPDAPENSLTAYRKAIEHGFMIEIDIRLTADGEVVIFHDDDLRRLFGVDRKVEDMTLAELQTYRLPNTQETIPTLQECLAAVNGKVALLIEFKCMYKTYRSLCEKANAILSTYKGPYMIQSFYPLVLRWYKRHRRDICRGQLAAGFKGEAYYKRLLGHMVFNCLARPDFVSYDHLDESHPARRLVTGLGAFPVGWTFTSEDAVRQNRHAFRTYIFEQFIPSNASKTTEDISE